LCADLAIPLVNLLLHEPILWPVKVRALDTGLQQYTAQYPRSIVSVSISVGCQELC
jgi:hypothetical protein